MQLLWGLELGWVFGLKQNGHFQPLCHVCDQGVTMNPCIVEIYNDHLASSLLIFPQLCEHFEQEIHKEGSIPCALNDLSSNNFVGTHCHCQWEAILRFYQRRLNPVQLAQLLRWGNLWAITPLFIVADRGDIRTRLSINLWRNLIVDRVKVEFLPRNRRILGE